MKLAIPSDYEVLILAPLGRDADAAAEVLRKEKFLAQPFRNLPDLLQRLKRPAGAALIAEEALSVENLVDVRAHLDSQEPWSNMPVILMTNSRERPFSTEQIVENLGAQGLISILERPFHIVTLLAAVRVALQAREKQYQVREFLQEQAAALQQRDEFLSIASHELKTPITSLKLQAQMRRRSILKNDLQALSPDSNVGFVNKIDTQLDRLCRLVDDMLDISRIENGKLALNKERVDLGELAREVVDGFAGQFQSIGTKVSLNIDAHVVGNWDRYRLEQVIANLLTNSIKYGGGKPVEVTVSARDGRAILMVRDHGPGIAPESREKIFQRFERAGAGKAISGLGLGLYISRQILELHAGKIFVEEPNGGGSQFVVELPASEIAENRIYGTA